MLLVLAIAYDAIANTGKIHSGVSVGGVSVGGLSAQDAEKRLSTELPRKASATVTATYGDSSFPVAPAQIGLTFDSSGLASEAFAVGRSGSLFARVHDRLSSYGGGVSIEATAIADASMLGGLIDSIAAQIDKPATDASVKVEGTKLSVVPSAAGSQLDTETAGTKIVLAFTGKSRQVALPVSSLEPDVQDEAAEAAKSMAEIMLSSPVKVTYSDKSWSIEPGAIAKTLAFRKVESTSSAGLEPYVSTDGVTSAILPTFGSAVGKAAKDASFRTSGGSVVIVPSEEGTGPDVESLANDLTKVTKSDASAKTVELHVRTLEPELTTAEAQAMGITQKISTFTTTYSAGNGPRVNNIHVLGDALDGTLIAPGATFSFNGTVGERTAAKGYQEAPAIVNGVLVPQLGGGICQVGTTLFNAAFFSGLPIVERHNHSVYISHYPTGRDATVSWGGPDLKFKNDTSEWVLISVSYTSGSITISLWGQKPGYEVAYTTSPFTDVKPFTTTEVQDATLPVGTRIVETAGTNGMACTVTRTVTKGGTVISTDTFKSVYKMAPEVVRVGTKPAETAATP
ncbi:MAG: VanW family protein [Coriobacteriia bacterium]